MYKPRRAGSAGQYFFENIFRLFVNQPKCSIWSQCIDLRGIFDIMFLFIKKEPEVRHEKRHGYR